MFADNHVSKETADTEQILADCRAFPTAPKSEGNLNEENPQALC